VVVVSKKQSAYAAVGDENQATASADSIGLFTKNY